MKDITLPEIKELKNKLENDIRNSILEFEKETETAVFRIDIGISRAHLFGERQGVAVISIDTYLDI